MKEKIMRIISQVMEVPLSEINEQSSIDNIANWNSMKHINLILALEEEFKMHFTESQVMEMLSVDAIFQKIQG